ncbi:MAG: DUF2334 domain-containing protein [Lachnospiraceae bacterium]|nr:DUF2334 domain-containing protein [Lachnospiraceae bacterium]
MKIAIRLDDITPGMDWKKFERFRELLDSYDVQPLIGVVPDCRDPKLDIDPPREDFWEYIHALEDSGWVIAMHGCHHLYTTSEGGLFPLNRKSEFAGLSYEEQLALLRHGREIFTAKGIRTDLFMAPSHSYDLNTLRALKETGFHRITDGFGSSPYQWEGMIFYPISFDKNRAVRMEKSDPARATGMHRASPAYAPDAAVTIVTHTNVMSDGEFGFFERLLKNNTENVISYREMLKMPAKPASRADRLKEYWMAAGKRMIVSGLAKLHAGA